MPRRTAPSADAVARLRRLTSETIVTLYYPSDAAIAAIVAGFLDLSLPKAEWTHVAHFATTLRLLKQAPERDLPLYLADRIRAYNAAVGGVNSDEAGYHDTITRCSIRAARAFLASRADGEPLHEVVDALMASPLGRSDWPLRYWSHTRLMSVAARRGWIEPDLEPLPY